jgi:hypothetical protein
LAVLIYYFPQEFEEKLAEMSLISLSLFIAILIPIKILEFVLKSNLNLIRIVGYLIVFSLTIVSLGFNFWILFLIDLNQLVVWTASYIVGFALNFFVLNPIQVLI